MYKNLEEEKKYLSQTLNRFQEIISSTEQKLQVLPRIYKDNPALLNSLLFQYHKRLSMLNKTKKKPYFARIDFQSAEDHNTVECYIGKVGVQDDDHQLVTVDWRAPIATLYYDSNIGPSEYYAPEGLVVGNLLLKRQYDIENGSLLNFQDVDTVSNDDILKPYLNANNDRRLKNIVATIQSEQNEIIRAGLQNNLIIQGVAGSGKTTVALHRIAYLVYNNMDFIQPEQYLVIGPNKFFVNYISGVLPDLDVDYVAQVTYEEIVKQLLKEKFSLITDENKLIESIHNSKRLSFEKLRVSMIFKESIDLFLKDFDENILPKEDFKINDYQIIPYSIIKKIYTELEDHYYEIVNQKIERMILLLGKYIKNHYEQIHDSIYEQFRRRIEKMDHSNIEKERKHLLYIEKEIKNGCKTSLKKYFHNAFPKILNLYHSFLKNIENYLENIDEYDTHSINQVINNIKAKKVEFEDLAALIYLNYRIYGSLHFSKYRHTVIDEAQDYGEFNFFVLKKLLSNSTFSIFGDLAQSIYQYRSIDNWECIIVSSFLQKGEIKYLTKSYRTTTEIMNAANHITKYLGLNTAEPVIRHGVSVNYRQIKDSPSTYILSILSDYQNKGYQSIAIICKDQEEAYHIYSDLKNHGISLFNITSADTKYQGGICTITSYLSKGLEFDGVIIANASENVYHSTHVIDMKLLYVSMTRALHELQILFTDDLCLALKDHK